MNDAIDDIKENILYLINYPQYEKGLPPNKTSFAQIDMSFVHLCGGCISRKIKKRDFLELCEMTYDKMAARIDADNRN